MVAQFLGEILPGDGGQFLGQQAVVERRRHRLDHRLTLHVELDLGVIDAERGGAQRGADLAPGEDRPVEPDIRGAALSDQRIGPGRHHA